MKIVDVEFNIDASDETMAAASAANSTSHARAVLTTHVLPMERLKWRSIVNIRAIDHARIGAAWRSAAERLLVSSVFMPLVSLRSHRLSMLQTLTVTGEYNLKLLMEMSLY